MAEKGFGVKEVNLIGASGTPTITSPNNLNLNANNVAISTNVSIGGTLSVTGNVSVGGTLTYEDVTNIDSVGVITARSGVDVDDFISVGSNIHLGNAGVVTATTFSGSAASLTSVPAANITGTLPAISGANLTGITITPTNSDIQVVYTVTANGSSAYRFAGNGVVSTADDPDLYLMRGQKYRFINNSGGSHPFQIRTSAGADGAAYSTGVTNNGASSGNIDFAPTYDSPAQLVYQCTSHSGMVGNIYLRDAAGGNTNVGVTTFANITANNINGTPDINVGTGEADIYSTGSGDQLSLRLLNSDTTSGNKIGIYFGPCNNVAGAYIKGVAEADFTSTANRDAGLEFGTRLNGNFLAPLKISAAGYVTKPIQPCAVVYQCTGPAGGAADASSDNGEPLHFDHVHINQGGMTISNDNARIQVPITGIYFVSYMVSGTVTNVDLNDGIELILLRNGNEYPATNSGAEPVFNFGASANNEEFFCNNTLLVSLTAGDYVEAAVDNIGNSDANINRGNLSVMLMA